VPVVKAPEGSGCGGWAGCGCNCSGLTPEVEGVGEECGVLGASETLIQCLVEMQEPVVVLEE
jgi:hypothetical protein